MIRELNHLTRVLLAGFVIVALTVTYWAVVRAGDLRAREDNLRTVRAEQRIRRGTIVDRDGVRLAYTEVLDSGDVQRVYPYPEAVGAVGYYSFEYGTAGIEAAFDAQLRGEGLRGVWERFAAEVLHRPQRGRDVRATLDLDVQQAATRALGGRRGAVVVAHVPSGRVLAMVSQPGYDPNRIDAIWERVIQRQDNSPLLNRVTAGLYQPGGALQTVLLSAILSTYPDLGTSSDYVLNTNLPDAARPVPVGDPAGMLVVECLVPPPDRALSLAEAYAYGCPAPFAAALGDSLPPERLWERYAAFGLLEPPALAGFRTTAGRPPVPFDAATLPGTLRAEAVGQGALTVTPLQMLQVVAAVANQGQGIPLHLVDAVRDPGAESWQPVAVPVREPALLRADVAAAVRLTMLQTTALNPYVRQAQGGSMVLYGHSALAYGGPDARPYAWFTGFVDQSEGDKAAAVAVVVVVEDEPDPGVAAAVARAALAAATGR